MDEALSGVLLGCFAADVDRQFAQKGFRFRAQPLERVVEAEAYLSLVIGRNYSGAGLGFGGRVRLFVAKPCVARRADHDEVLMVKPYPCNRRSKERKKSSAESVERRRLGPKNQDFVSFTAGRSNERSWRSSVRTVRMKRVGRYGRCFATEASEVRSRIGTRMGKNTPP